MIRQCTADARTTTHGSSATHPARPLRGLYRSIGACMLATVLAHGIASAEIVVAQIAAFTGPQAPVGQGLNAGISLYLDSVNASGGIHGQTIRLVAKDDGYKADATAKLAKEVIAAENPIALISVQGTANNEALLKENILSVNGIPLIGPRSGSLSLQDNPYIFHVRASYRSETERLVESLTAIGANQIAVVYQDDGLGADGLKGVEDALKAHKLVPVAKIGFERNTVKVEGAVAAMLKANVQAIVFIGVISPAAEFVKQYRTAGGTAQIVGLDLIDAAPLVKLAGVDKASGVVIIQVLPSPERLAIPLIKEMRALLARKGDKAPPISYVTVEGYVAAKVFVEGLRRAGPKPTRAGLVRALEGMNDYDVGGYYIKYGARKHDGSTYSELGVVGRDGKLHL